MACKGGGRPRLGTTAPNPLRTPRTAPGAAVLASVEVRVGVSFISSHQARTNARAQAQVAGAWMSFEEAASGARAAWADHLSVIDIHAGADATGSDGDDTADLVRQLYSAHYRTGLAPTQFSEPSPATGAE